MGTLGRKELIIMMTSSLEKNTVGKYDFFQIQIMLLLILGLTLKKFLKVVLMESSLKWIKSFSSQMSS